MDVGGSGDFFKDPFVINKHVKRKGLCFRSKMQFISCKNSYYERSYGHLMIQGYAPFCNRPCIYNTCNSWHKKCSKMTVLYSLNQLQLHLGNKHTICIHLWKG